MSKVLTDQIEKRTGGTAMDVPATGKWPEGNIADDAVTLAKMAGLARGKLIVGDSSGDPSALTVGTADQVLTSDGTDAAWSTLETGTSWQAVKTAAFTAVAGEGYPINTTSAAITVTLPATASVGDTIECIDYARKWGTNAVTINPNSLNYQGNTTPQPVYNTTGESFRIVYVDATQGWVPVFDGAVALETPQNYDIDFLVIAGGGSGGSTSNSGGGGAGGYRTSTQNIDSGVVFTVTVGDGGSASSSAIGVNGSDSSVSGSGLTTITSAGGGGGALGSGGNGLAGGSGGGGGNGGTGGAGNTPSTSPGQGYAGGNGVNSPPAYGAGGGGGASEVGETGTGSKAGDGGDGIASSISGASVTRGGGGGGGTDGAQGLGGAGGGGNASAGSGNGFAGTVNTGGGGGAGEAGSSSGAGGKGVVILSMPDGYYSGTTTGSPTVATGQPGGKTTLVFTASGSYTS